MNESSIEGLPIESFLAIPCEQIINSWNSWQPLSNPDGALLERAPTMLNALARLTHNPNLAVLREAIELGNERSFGALAGLDKCLADMCEVLLQRCSRWEKEKDWTTLRHEALLAGDLAEAIGCGHDREGMYALFFLGNAFSAEKDKSGAIKTYEAAIDVAHSVGDRRVLTRSYSSLGSNLSDVGRLDEALECFSKALEYEDDSRGVSVIEQNRAIAYGKLGEFRSASAILQDRIRELERSGVDHRELALTLCDVASMLPELGDSDDALVMLERASPLFTSEDLEGRAYNALVRATVSRDLGNEKDAAQAFTDAYALALDFARHQIDSEHYRRGFKVACSSRIPIEKAVQLLATGVAMKEANEWQPADARLQQAALYAREHGDEALALRIEANLAAMWLDAGQFQRAKLLAEQVLHEAKHRGFALPERMVTSTLGSLSAMGADFHVLLGMLGLYTKSAALFDLHARIVAEAGLAPREAYIETYDIGTLDNELAILAERYFADELAANLFAQSIRKARAVNAVPNLVNRLAGLHAVLSRSGGNGEANKIANELSTLLLTEIIPELQQLVACRELANHHARSNPDVAIGYFRQACSIAESLRQKLEPGSGRAEVNRGYPRLFHRLAEMLRMKGDDTGAFEALQGDKGRRLTDILAARAMQGGLVEDGSPNFQEVLAMLASLGQENHTVLVDLAQEKNGLTAYIVQRRGVQAIYIPRELPGYEMAERGDVHERESHLASVCLHEHTLGKLVEAVSAVVPKDSRLLVVPDGILHNFPLHITPLNGRPWCDHFPISYIPAVGALRFLGGKRQASALSLVAGDSGLNLPHAAAECREIAALLGTDSLIGEKCSRDKIESTLRGAELDVIHLAVHGRGDTHRGGRASLLLGDGYGSTEWVAFDDLARLGWRAKLVVFSGCSTAVAGHQMGHELISVARAALEAGATSVIACLWPVGDQATSKLMISFYEKLVSGRKNGPVDLRVALDAARTDLRAWLDSLSPSTKMQRRDGRRGNLAGTEEVSAQPINPELAKILTWGPFMLLGHPMFTD